MEKTTFEYVTYIATTPERVWKALTEPKVTVKYWQMVNVSDWKPGSRWEHRQGSRAGDLFMVGKVLESSPPARLVWTWAMPADEAREEKYSRVTFEIVQFMKGVIRLTVIHDRLEPGSEMLRSIAEGWPKVLSSMKSLLERKWPLPQLWEMPEVPEERAGARPGIKDRAA